MIDSHVEKDDLLIIASHQPPTQKILEIGYTDEQDPNWNEKHIWSQAQELYFRITQKRKSCKNIWLSGDIHKSANIMTENICFVTTGRLGSSIEKKTFIQRQAKIIHIPKEKSEFINTTLVASQFTALGHNDLSFGRWEPHDSFFQVVKNEGENNRNQSLKHTTIKENGTINSGENSEHIEIPLELLSDDLQNAILNSIRNKDIYYWGRFQTWKEYVSLSWVPVGPLLADGQLLAHLIAELTFWIFENIFFMEGDDQFPNYEEEDVVLIGTDCWGSIIASQLTITTGIKNYCISTRDLVNTKNINECFELDSKETLLKTKNIIIVTDVIGTGSTIELLKKALNTPQTGLESLPEWHVLSIICDKKRCKYSDLSFVSKHVTACWELRMPVMHRDDLPDESILPPKLSWNG